MPFYPKKKMPNVFSNVRSWTTPRISCNSSNSETCIVFYAYDPATDKLRRKRIRINNIKPASQRRKYAEGLMKRLVEKLTEGWNPWITPDIGENYPLLSDTLNAYRAYVSKMYRDGIYREATLRRYVAHLSGLEKWCGEQKPALKYVYQVTKEKISRYLDHVFVKRNNCAATRDNYLATIRHFTSWAMSRDIMKTDPTDGIDKFSRRLKQKKRGVINGADLTRIAEYAREKNPHFLLACYLIYYCFVRPKEMGALRIGDISVKRQTLHVSGEISKNRRDGVVTLPVKVLRLMIDLGIFNSPSSYFIFSEDMKPGKRQVSEKQLRDYWKRHVCADLGLPDTYKFYSLKDTGITDMLRTHDALSVRDQARHSSIEMTNIYTPHDVREANERIKGYEGGM